MKQQSGNENGVKLNIMNVNKINGRLSEKNVNKLK